MIKKGGFSIGEIMGVEVTLNPLLILSLIAFAVFGSLEVLASVYLCVAVHEMAHCLTARALHIRVERIELLPFGCAARIEEALELKPLSEAAIAIMGPISNLVLAMIAVFLRYCFWPHLDIVRFVQINALLGGLNLLPALPLDGGRFLRGLFASRLGVKRATSAITVVSFAVAAAALGVGVYFAVSGMLVPNLFFIALLIAFYAMTGRRAKAYVQLKAATNNSDLIKRRGRLRAETVAVMKDYPIGRLIDSLLPGRYHIIAVIDQRYRRIGTISEGELMDGFALYGGSAPVEMLVRQ